MQSNSENTTKADSPLAPSRLRGVRVGYLSAAMQPQHTFDHLKQTVESVRGMLSGDGSEHELEDLYEEARQGAKSRGVTVPALRALNLVTDGKRNLPSTDANPIPKAVDIDSSRSGCLSRRAHAAAQVEHPPHRIRPRAKSLPQSRVAGPEARRRSRHDPHQSAEAYHASRQHARAQQLQGASTSSRGWSRSSCGTTPSTGRPLGDPELEAGNRCSPGDGSSARSS
jgi:hypothetical protein